MAECNFEKDLEKLEQIVAALEEGGLSLDDSLKQFEQGIKLARRCERTLSEAEKKIEILTKKAGGELATEPFEKEDEAAESELPAKPSKPAAGEETMVAEIELTARKRHATAEGNGTDDEEDEGTLLF